MLRSMPINMFFFVEIYKSKSGTLKREVIPAIRRIVIGLNCYLKLFIFIMFSQTLGLQWELSMSS